MPPGPHLIPVPTTAVEVADHAERFGLTGQMSAALSAGSLSSRAIPHRPPSSQAAIIQVLHPRASSTENATTDAVTPAAAGRRPPPALH